MENGTKESLNRQETLQGACSTFFLSCVGLSNPDSTNTISRNILPDEMVKNDSIPHNGWDQDTYVSSDQELLEDLELVLEGRGLVTTIFLPSKNPNEPTSVARTAFIRSKCGDPKIECQVVVDNEHVANGTLKRFKFSVFDVVEVTKGKNRNSVIPIQVTDETVMRFKILKKGELHFVFESHHVRNDIVQGFKLLIAKKILQNQKSDDGDNVELKYDDTVSHMTPKSAFDLAHKRDFDS